MQQTIGQRNFFCKEWGIVHLTGAPYHPATNGAAEHLIQMFKQALRKSSKPPKKAVVEVLMQYWRTPTAVGYSPSELLTKGKYEQRSTPCYHLLFMLLKAYNLKRPWSLKIKWWRGFTPTRLVILVSPFTLDPDGIKTHVGFQILWSRNTGLGVSAFVWYLKVQFGEVTSINCDQGTQPSRTKSLGKFWVGTIDRRRRGPLRCQWRKGLCLLCTSMVAVHPGNSFNPRWPPWTSQHTATKIWGVHNDNISLENCIFVELDRVVFHNLTGRRCGVE